MVKASELIKAMQENDIEVDITDEGDSGCYLQRVEVVVDEEDHTCSLRGYLACKEDDAKYGLEEGECEANILGITFTKPYLTSWGDITIDGEIEYDEDLEESDVIEAAENFIDWPSSEDSSTDFDEDSVDDDELLSAMECEYDTFALNEDDEICAFEDEEAIPATGYKVIDSDEAYDRLVKERPGLYYDFYGID